MASAKRLPSGTWRVQVFEGYEYLPDGTKKRKYQSFTARTKKEAEYQAAQWNCLRNERPETITVKRAVEAYVESRKPVLSPSTIRGYNVCAKRFNDIADLKLTELRTSNVQPWISGMALDLSRKTIINTFGLLTAVLEYYGVNVSLKVRFPAKRKKEYDLPSDADIQKILKYTEGTTLWTAIMLARYYSLRRSEICALDKSALRGNVLTIRKACVMDENGNFIIKDTPKTFSSYRKLTIEDPLLSKLQEGMYFTENPGILSDRFRTALKEAGVRHFNFHLLRHVFASKAAIMGIPDFYVAQIGGWEPGSAVLKGIYQNVQKEELDEKMRLLNGAMQSELEGCAGQK